MNRVALCRNDIPSQQIGQRAMCKTLDVGSTANSKRQLDSYGGQPGACSRGQLLPVCVQHFPAVHNLQLPKGRHGLSDSTQCIFDQDEANIEKMKVQDR
jgi:hypothetical protein